jgi:hypothetical protein
MKYEDIYVLNVFIGLWISLLLFGDLWIMNMKLVGGMKGYWS